MTYIIDANNLAGKLELLSEDDFDKLLIKIVKDFFSEKKIEVFLVFDPRDALGDKINDNFLTVVYTPRDSYYKSADDKILEICESILKKDKDEVSLVTDDLEIIKKAKTVSEDYDKSKLFIVKATDFAKRINFEKYKKDSKANKNYDLDEDEIDDINEELLSIWK